MTATVAIALAALLVVETGGEIDPANAVGEAGEIGAYQILPIALEEANKLEAIEARRGGRPARTWGPEDRWCMDASHEMAAVTLRHHYRRGVTDAVDLACRWNRPDGSARAEYRRRIDAAINGGIK